MSIIDIKNLEFTYVGDSKAIFKDLNIQLDGTWKLGLIGRNGYGKTTLFNILMGNLEYKGTISSNFKFEYFPYKIENSEYLTLDVVEVIKGSYELWKLERELNLLNVNLDVLYRPFNTLSGGEQTKVLIASMFITEEDFLLIDEPTNSLDMLGRHILAKYLNTKKGFILISHDREFLNEIVDHVLTIEKKKIILQKGNYDTWESNKKLEDDFNKNKNGKLKKEIDRLEKSSREKATWSDKVEATKGDKISGNKSDKGFISHKATKMMKRSKSLEKRYGESIDEKKGLLTNIEFEEDLTIETISYYNKNLLTVENYSVFYNDENRLFKEINLSVENKKVYSVVGENGCGKSSFLKSIVGKDIKNSGVLKIASNVKISYLPQRFALEGELDEFIENSNIDKTKFLTLLRKMGINRELFEKDLQFYSSGQKKKVLIAKSICQEANLYIWDEPLNYLDVMTRIQIEKMILKNKPTMIIVEHDKRFLDNIGAEIINLKI